ncbi:MAG: hypothetical protein OIF58_13350, partial [Cohaesibacter sp.]|nr:hypothetical protein [Cohaesibacter sp.]
MKFWDLHFQGLWWLLGLAGPVTSEILELQIVMLMVFAGRATDEILRLHFVRLVVFAAPASNRIIVLQIVTVVVLTGPATDEIWEPLFARFVVVAGPGWTCHCEILELQIVRLIVSAPATGEMLRLHLRLMVLAGP